MLLQKSTENYLVFTIWFFPSIQWIQWIVGLYKGMCLLEIKLFQLDSSRVLDTSEEKLNQTGCTQFGYIWKRREHNFLVLIHFQKCQTIFLLCHYGLLCLDLSICHVYCRYNNFVCSPWQSFWSSWKVLNKVFRWRPQITAFYHHFTTQGHSWRHASTFRLLLTVEMTHSSSADTWFQLLLNNPIKALKGLLRDCTYSIYYYFISGSDDKWNFRL